MMDVDTHPAKGKEVKAEEDVDLYLKMKELENKLEILDIQEEYIKDELRQLQSELVRSKEEVSKFLIQSLKIIDPSKTWLCQADSYTLLSLFRFSEFKVCILALETSSRWLMLTTVSLEVQVAHSSMCEYFPHSTEKT